MLECQRYGFKLPVLWLEVLSPRHSHERFNEFVPDQGPVWIVSDAILFKIDRTKDDCEVPKLENVVVEPQSTDPLLHVPEGNVGVSGLRDQGGVP